MIGIIGNSRKDGKTSFGTLIKYCAKDGRAAYTGMQNIHFPESAAEEMESLAFENPRCKDPLMHIILSWREMELPTRFTKTRITYISISASTGSIQRRIKR